MKINQKGFTLVELLVVIVVLSLLIALAMPTVLDVMKSSQKKIYADQLLSYAKDVTNVFAARKSDIGVLAETCYMINSLKTTTGNTGCIKMDYVTGQPASIHVYDNTYSYNDSYTDLATDNGKVISEITPDNNSSTVSAITAICPSTCVDPNALP